MGEAVTNTKRNIMTDWRIKYLLRKLEWRIRKDLLKRLQHEHYKITHVFLDGSLYIKYEGEKFGLEDLAETMGYKNGGNGAKILINNPRVSYTYESSKLNVWKIENVNLPGYENYTFVQHIPNEGEDKLFEILILFDGETWTIYKEIKSNIVFHANRKYEPLDKFMRKHYYTSLKKRFIEYLFNIPYKY